MFYQDLSSFWFISVVVTSIKQLLLSDLNTRQSRESWYIVYIKEERIYNI